MVSPTAVLLLAVLQAGPVGASDGTATTTAPRDHVAACAPAPADDGDIVVCGRRDRNEQYRLRPLTHRYDPVSGPGVGFKLGAGQGNVYSTSQKSPDGKPDKRIVMRVVFPF